MDRLILTMGKEKLVIIATGNDSLHNQSIVELPRMEVIRLIHLMTYALMKGEGYKANMNVKIQ